MLLVCKIFILYILCECMFMCVMCLLCVCLLPWTYMPYTSMYCVCVCVCNVKCCTVCVCVCVCVCRYLIVWIGDTRRYFLPLNMLIQIFTGDNFSLLSSACAHTEMQQTPLYMEQYAWGYRVLVSKLCGSHRYQNANQCQRRILCQCSCVNTLPALQKLWKTLFNSTYWGQCSSSN